MLIPLAIVTLAVSALSLLPENPASAKGVAIDAGANWFCSASFQDGNCTTTLTEGDTITWTAVEGAHTVTECDVGHTNCGNGFDSGVLQQGESFSQTFNTPGTYSYYCAIHPIEMRGTIIVQEVTPTPVPSTTAPSETDTATAEPTTVQTPGTVPQTGSEPPASGTSLTLLVLAAGVLLAIAGGSALLAACRR
jgi:plastocyanin